MLVVRFAARFAVDERFFGVARVCFWRVVRLLLNFGVRAARALLRF